VFRLQNFYQAIDGPVFPAGIASPGVIKVYKLTDLPPRIPIATDTVVISDGAGTTLPTEVACCISYASAAVSGIPAARRRGRVYIGPLASASLTVVSGKTVITSTVRAALASAADGLRVNSNLDQVPWCVYSPTTATFPGDLAAAHTVTHGYVDDAFDTVRSRGSDATTRTLWP
jgi:hypothetical protein